MDLILIMIKNFLAGIFLVLNNPFSILIIVACILIIIYYPKIRGYMGEYWVKQELKKLPEQDYTILNDIMIENEKGTHQIDHIIISKYGIFVIEMKNYYGLIIGDEFNKKWMQYLGKRKYQFKNPIHQNYGHAKTLEELLNLDNKLFIPIVCFSNQVKLNIKTKSRVVQLDNLSKTIKEYNDVLLTNNTNEIKDIILKSNILDKSKRKQHIKNIKKTIKDNKIKEDNMECPMCGNKLIERNGKYGTFIGCTNYPKCKYIKVK